MSIHKPRVQWVPYPPRRTLEIIRHANGCVIWILHSHYATLKVYLLFVLQEYLNSYSPMLVATTREYMVEVQKSTYSWLSSFVVGFGGFYLYVH
ncbi:hypothetical protein L1987_69869 [Smallanthus sonchifolius]|uniref:Uncharacterized protein n=1 Tax=Smallanthus sonchifolius TaxID=185202 RepID=A0ACB9B8L7_9ASTR|nr:hypothetical protein L1987_69869 [Smallanthus sonchifolius]